AISENLHCTEHSCPLSSLKADQKVIYISQLSSHFNKRYEKELSSVFPSIYKELKYYKEKISTNAKQKITRHRGLGRESTSVPLHSVGSESTINYVPTSVHFQGDGFDSVINYEPTSALFYCV
ncbi:8308_t:CDS:2, partial [Ambispora gerdemannii]